jgi:hypothetical protein
MKFMARIRRAFEAAHTIPDLVLLLGVEPESPEVEYGWIEPVQAIQGHSQKHRVYHRAFLGEAVLGVSSHCAVMMNSLPTILALSVLVSAVNELGLLRYPTTARANEIATIDRNGGLEEIELSRASLTLVRFVAVTSEGENLGMIAIYDDPMTRRPEDSLELRDNDGHIVAVEWFDRFGIRRLTLDRGFLRGAGKFEHIFVKLVSGESI